MPVIKVPLITKDQYADCEDKSVPHIPVWMDPELSEAANYERLTGILKAAIEKVQAKALKK